jgi:hypothetical protein
MLEGLARQVTAMSLWEGLHTVSFTVFIVGGVVCCFVRSARPSSLPEKTPPVAASRSPRHVGSTISCREDNARS